MGWYYQVMEETIDDPLLGRYRTYGIKAKRKTVMNWEQIELLHDITRESVLAEALAQLCSRRQLSPIRLRSILNG